MWPRAFSTPRDQAADSNIDSAWLVQALGHTQANHKKPPVDRAKIILIFGLVGAALLVLWLRWLATTPQLPLNWGVDAQGHVVLESSTEPALQAAIGHRLIAIEFPDGQRIPSHAGLLQRSARWIATDHERAEYLTVNRPLVMAAGQAQVRLWLEPDLVLTVYPRPRGFAGLGLGTWGMSLLALLLYLVCSMVVPTLPTLSVRLYGLLALAQCVHVLLVAAELLPGMGWPSALAQSDLGLHLVADACQAAAIAHLVLQYPRPHAWARRLTVPVWCLAAAIVLQSLLMPLPGQWWWFQAGLVCAWAASTVQLQRNLRGQDNPMGRARLNLLRLGTGSLLLLSLASGLMSQTGAAMGVPWLLVGSALWQASMAALLLIALFMGRPQPFLREYAALVCVAVGAAALNLLLLVAFPLRSWLALCLALMASLIIYLTARPWVLSLLMGNGPVRAVRMFEQLYRVARALEQTPQQVDRHLARLLGDMFDPLEVTHASRPVSHVRLASDGTTLVVPIPTPADQADDHRQRGALVLRFARRGQRLFTQDDKRLTERMLEQLRRAAAYDRAMEQGRSEERSRLAQDLHDDIGARLLTMMYKAPNAEMEEYIRHTLQDLKTLTRGLAASSHPLSHSAAEWKADIHQRLQAAGCQLHWTFSADQDIKLSVVQWSGLTRILRELVNNIISHAKATQVHLQLQLDQGTLTLLVQDDGQGQQPQAWAHGLGLGGVRKRAKLLDGQVTWTERAPRGIQCEVKVQLGGEPG